LGKVNKIKGCNQFTIKLQEGKAIIAIVVLGGGLFLLDLGDICLWENEAETACLAKNRISNLDDFISSANCNLAENGR
jgi:hypothetical protein